MTVKKLLIVAHAPSDNTMALLNAAVDGAGSPDIDGVAVQAQSPFETQPADVIGADAVLLGTTENLGYMSGALKDFFDRCYYPCLEETQGKPYALYIRAGQDGTGTRRGVETIITGLRWRAVSEPVLCRGEWDPAFPAKVRDLAMLMAAGLEAGVF